MKLIPKPPNWHRVYSLWKSRQITGREAMKLTGLSRSTFYRKVQEEREREYKKLEEEQNNEKKKPKIY